MISKEAANGLISKLADKNIKEVVTEIAAEKILANDEKLIKKARNIPEQELIVFLRKELEAPEKGILIAKVHHEKKLKEYAIIKRIAEIENIPEETAREYLLDIETFVCASALKKIINRS